MSHQHRKPATVSNSGTFMPTPPARLRGVLAGIVLAGIAFAGSTAEAGIALPDGARFRIVMPLQGFRSGSGQPAFSIDLTRGSTGMMTLYQPENSGGMAVTLATRSYHSNPYFLLGRPGKSGLRVPQGHGAAGDKEPSASLAYGYPSHAPYGSTWRSGISKRKPVAARPERASRAQMRRYYLALHKHYSTITNAREARIARRELTALYRLLTKSHARTH